LILRSLQSVPPLETFALSRLKLAGPHVRALLVGEKCPKVSLGGNIAEHVLPNTVGHVAKLFECQYVADDLRPVDWRNLALVCAEDFGNFSPPSRVVIHPVISRSSKSKWHFAWIFKIGRGRSCLISQQPNRARVKDDFDVPTPFRVLLLKSEPFLGQCQIALSSSTVLRRGNKRQPSLICPRFQSLPQASFWTTTLWPCAHFHGRLLQVEEKVVFCGSAVSKRSKVRGEGRREDFLSENLEKKKKRRLGNVATK